MKKMFNFHITWDRGLIKKIRCGKIRGKNWGGETADRISFFNPIENAFGVEVLKESWHTDADCKGSQYHVEVLMGEGHWYMDGDTRIKGNKIRVSQRLTCLEKSLFQDFVVRFCFDTESFTTAIIDEKIVRHLNRNIWYQHPVAKAILENEYQRLHVQVVSAETAGKFRQEMYVRDEPGHWIVHARFIPAEPYAMYWIRWTNRLFRLSLGPRLSALLMKIAPLKRYLWYLGERRGGRPNLQAQGLAYLESGESLVMDVVLEVQTK